MIVIPIKKISIIIMVRDKVTRMIGWGSKEVKVNPRVALTYMVIIIWVTTTVNHISMKKQHIPIFYVERNWRPRPFHKKIHLPSGDNGRWAVYCEDKLYDPQLDQGNEEVIRVMLGTYFWFKKVRANRLCWTILFYVVVLILRLETICELSVSNSYVFEWTKSQFNPKLDAQSVKGSSDTCLLGYLPVGL